MAAPGPAETACVNHKYSAGHQSSFNCIRFAFDSSVPQGKRDIFMNGARDWNGCPNQGTAASPRFPFMLGPGEAAPKGDVLSVIVRMVNGPDTTNPRRCGTYGSSTVVIYKWARLPNGSLTPCDTNNILHDTAFYEAGHILGFNDSDCSGYGMRDTEFTSSGNYVDRSWKSLECSTAETNNEIPWLIADLDDPCAMSHTHPECDEPLAVDPLVVDLNRDGFSFGSASPSDAVLFDHDGDGFKEISAWLAPGSRDAFLALDLNGNGKIDDGTELLGNASLLPADGGRADHGFLALAAYDDPRVGGNADGILSRKDAVWRKLLLWRDFNADAETQEGELMPLRTSRLAQIELGFRRDGRRDQHGNRTYYEATAWEKVGPGDGVPLTVVDVFFVGPE